MTENGIADVIEMRDRGMVEKKNVFELAGVADHAVVPDDYMFTDVGIVANFAIAADNGGALDHRSIFYNGPFSNEHLLPDVSHAFATIAQAGTKIRFEVVLDLWESLPAVFTAFKNAGVIALREIKQVCGSEHEGKLRISSDARKRQNLLVP